jgi:hypothetical protein
MTMSSGLYGFASLKGEVGLEAGGSWLVLEGKSILTYRESGDGVGMAGDSKTWSTPISRIGKEVV